MSRSLPSASQASPAACCGTPLNTVAAADRQVGAALAALISCIIQRHIIGQGMPPSTRPRRWARLSQALERGGRLLPAELVANHRSGAVLLRELRRHVV
jgi:hypothetical protein